MRILKLLFVIALVVTPIAWLRKGTLEEPSRILPQLRQEPVQEPVSAPDFSFVYKGQQCLVRPVTTYEIWGLVVSHNNIESFADLYHDSTSVDTKDLCVIWGDNLATADYQKVHFRSGSFTCYFRYPAGVRFSMRQGSNNHLITDSELIRDRIDDVRVGDQVRLKGMLVNYRMDDWRDFWRESSLVRTDDGCEVVFVEELEILRQGTPGWYLLFRIGWITLILVPVLYLVTLHRQVKRGGPAS